MTPRTPLALTPDVSLIIARWAGLAAGVEAAPALAATFQAFRERVERLHAIDVETVEFDFLRPME